MFKLINEYRAIIFTLLIVLAANAVFYFTLKKLEDVSDKLSKAIQQEQPSSVVGRQILIEIRSAEYAARAYNLNGEAESLKAFYVSSFNVKKHINELLSFKARRPEDAFLLDSIAFFGNECLYVLKGQSFLKNPKSAVGKLDELNAKIDSIYKEGATTTENTSGPIQDSIKKRTGFFKRLFGKKKETKAETDVVQVDKAKENAEVKKKLKAAVKKAKHAQTKIMESAEDYEYDLVRTIFITRVKISEFVDRLRAREEKRKSTHANVASTELAKLKGFTIGSAAALTVFLLVLALLMGAYIRKKNQFANMLVNAKLRAEDLANTKQSFLSNMSHEIKTPLNAIYGFSELLQDSKLTDEQKSQVKIIRNSADYLTRLVNNILLYARLNSGKVKLNIVTVDLYTELQELFVVLNEQCVRKKLILKFEIDQLKGKKFDLDLDKFKQILYNILGNAIKFTEKGKVTLRVSYDAADAACLNAVVTDTGVGIDKSVLPALFEEFEQGGEAIYSKFGGTGLGLVICKRIVEELNGKVAIESERNVGTTVSIIVPVKENAGTETSARKVEQNNDIAVIKGKKILIVDDEEYNRLLLRSILIKQQATVVEAKTGVEAVALAKNQSFDAIIMDVRMPELNGIDATKEIRQFGKLIPIIGATAVVSEEKIARCMAAGMNDMIFKPYNSSELGSKLRNALVNEQPTFVWKQEKETASDDKTINLNAINESVDGDEKFKAELISVFHRSLNECLIKMESAVKEERFDTLSDLAHKLIPSCKHFEALELTKALKILEQNKVPNNRSKEEIQLILQLVKVETEKINTILKPFLSL